MSGEDPHPRRLAPDMFAAAVISGFLTVRATYGPDGPWWPAVLGYFTLFFLLALGAGRGWHWCRVALRRP